MKALEHEGFHWLYDATADVLHVSLDPNAPAYGRALKNFENVIIVMHSLADDSIVGLRILGTRENGLRELLLHVDKERRGITAFRVTGRVPEWQPEATDEDYIHTLDHVERILRAPPPKDLQLV